jgi:hypothetical protein
LDRPQAPLRPSGFTVPEMIELNRKVQLLPNGMAKALALSRELEPSRRRGQRPNHNQQQNGNDSSHQGA